MSIPISSETKTVLKRVFDRCYAINIRAPLGESQIVNNFYERVVEVDGQVMSKTPVYDKMYDAATIAGIRWTSPEGKVISGWDVFSFILWFNDNYDAAISQLTLPPSS